MALGQLIVTASISSIIVNIPQRQAAYNASKAAIVHLAKTLAVEWIDFSKVNLRITGVHRYRKRVAERLQFAHD